MRGSRRALIDWHPLRVARLTEGSFHVAALPDVLLEGLDQSVRPP
jgi:hypothetical protein